MGEFITGVLVQNEDGATYQSKVYDRFLKLRLLNGQVLSIFDPFGPVSTGLSIGEIYEMILLTLAVSVKYFSSSPPTLESNHWQGTIIEPRWKAQEESYQRKCPELYDHEWVLLSTSLGKLLMSPKEFSIPLSRGGIVQWDNVRLDLCAVV